MAVFSAASAVGGAAVGVGVGGPIGSVVQPLLQELANEAWRHYQSNVLSALDAAQLVASGERSRDWGRGEALNTGISSDRFDALVDMVDTAPDLATLLEMLRRNLISDADFAEGAKKGNIEDKWQAPLHGLRDRLLSPEVLANLRQQGFINPDRQHAESAQQGVNAERADLLFDVAGLPPGIETGLTMLRRGIITPAVFAQIVAEGHTKTKYTDELLQLQFQPMSVAIAAQGVLRERMTPAAGRAVAAQWGVSAATFDQIVENSGRPPGIQQATTLVNRGIFTEADFREVVARSNVRTEYADALLNLRVHYPPLFQLKRMVAAKDITPTTALDWLHKQGYLQPEWTQVVASWASETTQQEKELTKSEIVTLYEGRFMPPDVARTELTSLGYDTNEVGEILHLADARRIITFLNAALTKVRNQFVAHRIDESRALQELDAIGISSDARDDAIALWKIQRDANVQPVTRSEILRAMKQGAIGTQTAYDMLINIGVPDQSARILISTTTKHYGNPGELTGALP